MSVQFSHTELLHPTLISAVSHFCLLSKNADEERAQPCRAHTPSCCPSAQHLVRNRGKLLSDPSTILQRHSMVSQHAECAPCAASRLGFTPGRATPPISVSPGVADANGQTQLGSGPWQSAGAEHCQPSLGWECQRLSITLIPEGYFNIMTQGWVQHEPSPAGIALSPSCV